MNLGQITPECFVLALFIRDDGVRFLLGDGAYDFKEDQLHFAPNNVVNSVVELQGANGQVISGQVLRTAEQLFEGFIGDATTDDKDVRDYQQDFFRFFQIDHKYDVIYVTNQSIVVGGTTIPFALRRTGGYISTAPSVQTLRYNTLDYSVGFEFEDVNYYVYAEDATGKPIAVQTSGLVNVGSTSYTSWTTTNLTGFAYSPIITLTNFGGAGWQGIEFDLQCGTQFVSMTLNYPNFLASNYATVEIVVDCVQKTVLGKFKNLGTNVVSTFNLTSYMLFYNDWLKVTGNKGASITTRVALDSTTMETAKATMEYYPIWQ